MPIIRLELFVHAPPQRVFDLARDIDLHMKSTAATGEQAVAGVTTGLIGMGQRVTWRARHFGITQHLTVEITKFDAPHHFRDTMISGAFARFDHDHHFHPDAQGTRMVDTFDYTSPLGPLGRLADALFLQRYMRDFLMERNRVIKETAESITEPSVAP